jgi:hypothetical protein
MTRFGHRRTPAGLLMLVGILSFLAFLAAGPSAFMRGISGISLAAVSGFGVGFLGTATRRTRPSRLWAADLMGSLTGMVLTIFLVREMSLQGHHFFNSWVLLVLPIAATCGSVLASTAMIGDIIDRL